jgi:repressor of nif and glnA expression
MLLIGTSNHSQNDLIESITSVVQENIKAGMAASPFVSVIVDESSDCSVSEQLCVVYRYIEDGQVVERLYKMKNVSTERTAIALKAQIVEV